MEQLSSSQEAFGILRIFSLDQYVVGMNKDLFVVTDVTVLLLKIFEGLHLFLEHVKMFNNLALQLVEVLLIWSFLI